jgi:hypothetical protein
LGFGRTGRNRAEVVVLPTKVDAKKVRWQPQTFDAFYVLKSHTRTTL